MLLKCLFKLKDYVIITCPSVPSTPSSNFTIPNYFQPLPTPPVSSFCIGVYVCILEIYWNILSSLRFKVNSLSARERRKRGTGGVCKTVYK